MKVVGYFRVSTEEQAKGYSIEGQENEVRRICTEKGWEYFASYSDAGHGWELERPQLQKLLFDAEFAEFQLVLLTNIDRFSREPADSFPMIRQLLKHGVKVATTTIPDLDSSKKEFYLVQSSLIGQSKYFLMDLKDKQRMGIDVAKKKGIHLGRPPKGFAIGEDGYLEPDDLGRKAISLLAINPKISASNLAKELLVDYYQAWEIKKGCVKFLESKRLSQSHVVSQP